MTDQLNLMLAVALGVGFVGGFLLGRLARGPGGVVAWLLWLSLPFAVLAFILAQQTDASLPQERQDYNFAFGLVLLSIGVAVPWLPANLVGGIAGLLTRRRRTDTAPAAPVVVQRAMPPVAAADLPDWRVADYPKLDLAELGARMHEIAARVGLDPGLLPHVGPIGGDDGEFIDHDKFDYIYIGLDRGHALFDRRSVIADQLLYWIFVDQTLRHVGNRLVRERGGSIALPDEEYARGLAAGQQEMLAAIDPRWGAQFAADRAREAGG